MTVKKKIIISVLALIILVAAFAIWFKIEYSMGEAESYQLSTQKESGSLLIATQDSEFKNAVTHQLVEYYKKDSIFIDVIDVSLLKDIDPEKYNAILLIHTWENMKAPSSVDYFIKNNDDFHGKIIDFTTSGQGTYKMKGVDAIAGESVLKETTFYVEKLIKKIDSLGLLK